MSYHNRNNNPLPLYITIPGLILLAVFPPLSIIYVILACLITDKLGK